MKKAKNKWSLRYLATLSVLCICQFVSFGGSAIAQQVTKGYGADQVLQRGMVVGLTKNSTEKVEPIDITRLNTILGVIVNPNDSPITISADKQHIFVATAGRYDVLISDQEGALRAGDYVTLSAIAGIAMKATDQQSMVLGRAVEDFDGKAKVLSSQSLKISDGKQQTVNISRVKVDVAIAKNPLAKDLVRAPAFLDQVGQAVAGREISAIRLYVATGLFLLGSVIAGALLYAGIHSSIISIGRNPLGKRNIIKSMVGVAITSLLVFGVSLLGVYLILKL